MTTLSDVIELANTHAAETERLRRLHPEVRDALIGSGLLRKLIPKVYGGEEAPIGEVLDAIEAVSKADGSAGWCVMIASTTCLTAYSLPGEWGQKIYGDPAVCTGGFGMPAGKARVVDGGLEVTGRWAWGSGTDHCTWIGGGVHVVDDAGERSSTRDGATTPFVFFDLADVELLDTWHVAGLKGTASTDYSVEKAFVPEGRWVQLVGGKPVVDGVASRFPFFGALAAGVASVTIGLAERAVEELVLLGAKRSAGSSKTLAERAPIQADLALAIANIGQARTYMRAMLDEVWEMAASSSAVDDARRASLRLAVTAAAKRAVEAVDLCYHAAGGPAVYETSVLQRVFRDAHVATAHGMIAPRTLEPLGRLEFGLPTSALQF